MKPKSGPLVPASFQVCESNLLWWTGSAHLDYIGFAKLVDRDVILAKILPCVRDLAQDQSQHVRASLANQISGLAPLLGKDSTIENLLPLFLQLLKDDFPDVRLNIISKLETVNKGTKC